MGEWCIAYVPICSNSQTKIVQKVKWYALTECTSTLIYYALFHLFVIEFGVNNDSIARECIESSCRSTGSTLNALNSFTWNMRTKNIVTSVALTTHNQSPDRKSSLHWIFRRKTTSVEQKNVCRTHKQCSMCVCFYSYRDTHNSIDGNKRNVNVTSYKTQFRFMHILPYESLG